MSFNNLRNIREGSGSSPLEKEVSRLAKAWVSNVTKAQVGAIDEPEDIFPSGVDSETVAKLHDELVSTTQLFHDRIYRPTYEPDYNKVTLMLKGKSLGNTLKDYSGFDNHATIYGEPILVDGGPFDPGLFTGGPRSIAMRFNRPTSLYVNEESMSVPDSTKLQIAGISTGISIMFRFRIFDLAQQGSWGRTLFEKVDDSTPNNGYRATIEDNGHLRIRTKIGGVSYSATTATSLFATNKPYTVIITLTPTGTFHIYLKDESNPSDTGQELSLSDPGGTATFHSNLADHKLAIFTRGGTSTQGYLYGDFYNMYVYRERIISSAEATNFFTNKFTIYPQAFGRCMVTNHWQASA